LDDKPICDDVHCVVGDKAALLWRDRWHPNESHKALFP